MIVLWIYLAGAAWTFAAAAKRVYDRTRPHIGPAQFVAAAIAVPTAAILWPCIWAGRMCGPARTSNDEQDPT